MRIKHRIFKLWVGVLYYEDNISIGITSKEEEHTRAKSKLPPKQIPAVPLSSFSYLTVSEWR